MSAVVSTRARGYVTSISPETTLILRILNGETMKIKYA